MRNEIGPVRAARGCERRPPGRSLGDSVWRNRGCLWRPPGRSLGGSVWRNRGCPWRRLGRLCPDRRLGRAGNGFAPFQRRLDDLEVLGPVRVGEDDQPVAVVGDVVLDARLARGDENRRITGMARIDQPHLAGDVVVRVDQQETARFGEGDVHEEPRIRLFVDERVARGIVAEPMAEDPARAMVVVEARCRRGCGRPPPTRRRPSSARSRRRAAGPCRGPSRAACRTPSRSYRRSSRSAGWSWEWSQAPIR